MTSDMERSRKSSLSPFSVHHMFLRENLVKTPSEQSAAAD
jgi:hypothetical protein